MNLYEKYNYYKYKYNNLKKNIGDKDIIHIGGTCNRFSQENPNTIVSKISGANTFNYIKLPFKKILLFGIIHGINNPCSPCDIENNCYSISEYITKISQTKCIDIFQELDIILDPERPHKILSELQSLSLEKPVFKEKEDKFKEQEDKFEYKKLCNDVILTIRQLIPGNDFITKKTYYITHPYFKDYIPQNNILDDIINYIINNDPPLHNIEEKFKTLNQMEISLFKKILNIPTEELKLRDINREIMKSGATHKNIRFHYFDLRTISFKDRPDKIILTPDSIFPYSIHERIKLYDMGDAGVIINQYEEKLKEIALEHWSTDILSIIDYLSNNRSKYLNWYTGKQIFRKFHTKYDEIFKDITWMQYEKVIDIISTLIEKQINKSFFQPFEQFIFIFKKTMMETSNWWMNFLAGAILTELYSIPRMFKIFKPTIGTRKDSCDQNKENMENIIYIAGRAHTRFVYAFLKNWFNLSSEEDIIINVHINANDNQCIEIPHTFL